LPLLERKPRSFDHAAPVRAAQATWPKTYPLLLALFRSREGDAEGTRSFIRVLWLHKHHPADRVHAAVKRALTHESPSYAIVWSYLAADQQVATPPPLSGVQQVPAVHVEVGRPEVYLRLCQEVDS